MKCKLSEVAFPIARPGWDAGYIDDPAFTTRDPDRIGALAQNLLERAPPDSLVIVRKLPDGTWGIAAVSGRCVVS
jgi:hypothetical protein